MFSYPLKALSTFLLLSFLIFHNKATATSVDEIYCGTCITNEQFEYAAFRTGAGEKVVLNFKTMKAKRYIVIVDNEFNLNQAYELSLTPQEINTLNEVRALNLKQQIDSVAANFSTRINAGDYPVNGCGGEGMDIPDFLRNNDVYVRACNGHDACFAAGNSFEACNMAFQEDLDFFTNTFTSNMTDMMQRMIARRFLHTLSKALVEAIEEFGPNFYCKDGANADTATCIMHNTGQTIEQLVHAGHNGGPDWAIQLGEPTTENVVDTFLGRTSVSCTVIRYRTYINGESGEIREYLNCHYVISI